MDNCRYKRIEPFLVYAQDLDGGTLQAHKGGTMEIEPSYDGVLKKKVMKLLNPPMM